MGPRVRLVMAGFGTVVLIVGSGVSVNQVFTNGTVNWGWLATAVTFAGLGVATGGWAATGELAAAVRRPAPPGAVDDLEVSGQAHDAWSRQVGELIGDRPT